MSKNNSSRVYSTHAVERDDTGADETREMTPPEKQTAYIERDRKKRRGKTVIVIRNLKGDLSGLKKELQKHCGAGGSLKNNEIEIQGDHRDKIAAYLRGKGYKTKLVGG